MNMKTKPRPSQPAGKNAHNQKKFEELAGVQKEGQEYMIDQKINFYTFQQEMRDQTI